MTVASPDRLILDGSHGEGGGQILRTSLTFAAITGRAIRIERIRAGRAKPGLAPQHLTAVRAAASLCRATTTGDEIGSTTLEFAPRAAVAPDTYAFDVAAATKGGSAGATSLVLQTVLLPLALTEGRSRLSVRGGTHMAWSPPFDYVRDVWMPALAKIGIETSIELRASGWFPIGQGEIVATITGLGTGWRERLKPYCQTNANGSAKPHNRQISGCKLTPLSQSDGAIELEVFTVAKMAFLVEVIVD